MRSKIFYTFIMLVVVFSCQKEESGNNNRIIFSAHDGSSTLKSTLSSTTYATDWLAGDKIGVYCSAASPAGVNSPFTATTTGHTSGFTGGLNWGTGLHTFYAYYPYVAGTPLSTVVPISVATTQTVAAGVGVYDFLWADPVIDVPYLSQPDPAMVDLAFNHALTLFEFEVIVAPGSANAGSILTNIELKSTGSDYVAFTGGTIDIATGIITPPGTKLGTIDLTTNHTLVAGTTTKFFMVAYPQGGAKALVVSLTIGGTPIVAATKPAGWSYALGSRYTVTCNIP